MLIHLVSPLQILHARAKLNDLITSSIQDACEAWGMVVKRYEITEILPDKEISLAMDRQAAAERIRRERVLTAEGHKSAVCLEAEGEASAGEKKCPQSLLVNLCTTTFTVRTPAIAVHTVYPPSSPNAVLCPQCA